MTEHPAIDLGRRAFATATAARAIEHVAVCLTVGKIAWEAAGGEGGEDAAADAATDAIAFDKAGATRAAARELAGMDRDEAEEVFTVAQQRVGEAVMRTAYALVGAYTVLGGELEAARGLDPEHVALSGALALLTGADELYGGEEDK